VKAKRPLTVITHILQHGHVTTEELKDLYGYNHPPRAARDVREAGIPLETVRVRGSDGRQLAAYRFADLEAIQTGTLAGRKVYPKSLKQGLVQSSGERCQICGTAYVERYLQIDHRIPFEISGDSGVYSAEDFQLLCGSCQRAKSWSCEHCPNWNTKTDTVCANCYWAEPVAYTHIATSPEKRVVLVWSGDEIEAFKNLENLATSRSTSVRELIKDLAVKAGSQTK